MVRLISCACAVYLLIYLFIHSICLWVQVSHWGRVYVEERYRLRNSGAKVVPPYSRWNITEEAMSGQAAGSPHLRVLPMSLPKTAQYIYTKDDLGHTQVHTQLLDPLHPYGLTCVACRLLRRMQQPCYGARRAAPPANPTCQYVPFVVGPCGRRTPCDERVSTRAQWNECGV